MSAAPVRQKVLRQARRVKAHWVEAGRGLVGQAMTAHSRNKGCSGEREFCRLLSEALGTQISRNITQVRDGGYDILGVSLFDIEVRRREQVSEGAWWKEVCERPIADGRYPALAYRQNRKPWRILIPLRFFREKGGNEPVWLTLDGFVHVVRDAERG